MEQSLAEREGFEPSIRFWRILTFQASAFDHSATAPHALDRAALEGVGAIGKVARRRRPPLWRTDGATHFLFVIGRLEEQA